MKNLGAHRGQFVLGAVSAILLAALVILIKTGATEALDQHVRTLALGLNSPVMVDGWKILSFLGSTVFLSALLIVGLALLAIGRQWSEINFVAVATLGAILLDVGSKLIVHRPRAPEVYAHTMPNSFSFPSGHAFYSLLFYVSATALLNRRGSDSLRLALMCLALTLVLAIGASRVFLGVHYFTDVAGGYLLAMIWLPIAIAIRSAYSN